MERAQKVAIARFVMRGKQYLAAVRPKDGKLLLSTMVYADEVNGTDRSRVGDARAHRRERSRARDGRALIDSAVHRVRTGKFEDTYRIASWR